jgi:hypothetical protein
LTTSLIMHLLCNKIQHKINQFISILMIMTKEPVLINISDLIFEWHCLYTRWVQDTDDFIFYYDSPFSPTRISISSFFYPLKSEDKHGSYNFIFSRKEIIVTWNTMRFLITSKNTDLIPHCWRNKKESLLAWQRPDIDPFWGVKMGLDAAVRTSLS